MKKSHLLNQVHKRAYHNLVLKKKYRNIHIQVKREKKDMKDMRVKVEYT